ncbi:hypothetical protein PAMP_004612 [Pampus punctatissimus]
MLLLILFAACLMTCAAQTTSFSSSTTGMPTMQMTAFTQPIQVTSVQPLPDTDDNVVAILQTAVQSYRELNETNFAPVLNKLYDIIQQLRPDLNFTLTVKNITKV